MPGLDPKSLLHALLDADASDLHIKVGVPPMVRVHGDMKPLPGYPVLSADDTRSIALSMIDAEQRDSFNANRELDCSYATERARFRVNVMLQKGFVGMVIRVIPIKIKTAQELNLPEICLKLAEKPRGLVLVTGPTGSGKSTTLAAMIDWINQTEAAHIITIEDPVEFVHTDKKSIINQREVGSDTLSFSGALKRALRQDPDVILIGEMRDQETIGAAITAAETGHLVFGTLHTSSAPQTIDRIIDVFPHEAQSQVRSQLAVTIQGVLSQNLLAKVGGGRCLGLEVMVGNPAIRNLIREGKIFQIPSAMQAGMKEGMQTLEMHLAALIKAGTITEETGLERANDPGNLKQLLTGR
jgi:twitching motility protein PilT